MCWVELQGTMDCADWPSPAEAPWLTYWLGTGPEDGSRKLPSGKAVACLRFSAPELPTLQGYMGMLCRKGTGVLKGPERKEKTRSITFLRKPALHVSSSE